MPIHRWSADEELYYVYHGLNVTNEYDRWGQLAASYDFGLPGGLTQPAQWQLLGHRLHSGLNDESGAWRPDFGPPGDLVRAHFAAEGERFYFHDALGSTTMLAGFPVPGLSPAVAARYEFDPWGNQLNTPQPSLNRVNFTTYRHDMEIGLQYAMARYYQSTAGRFLQLDPVSSLELASSFDPTRAERGSVYSYAGNVPLRFTDPSGNLIELVGSVEAKRMAFIRVRDLFLPGDPEQTWLTMREENGHTYVGYRSDPKKERPAPGQGTIVTAALRKMIDHPTKTVEFGIAGTFKRWKVTHRAWRRVTGFPWYERQDVREIVEENVENDFGGGVTVMASESLTGNTQVFIEIAATPVANKRFRDMRRWHYSNDGTRLVYTNDIVDAHEFGHAWANFTTGLENEDTHWWALLFERVQRERHPELGGNWRVIH